jgi:hypothetical protein
MNEKTMSEYKFPTTGGGFTGVLKFKKKLNGKPCLLCYFLSDKGDPLKPTIVF